MRFWVSSILACEHPSLTILAMLNARHMLDCSSCTWPPCLAIVADMLQTCKKSVAASKYEFRVIHQPYLLPSPPLSCLTPVSSTLGDAYYEISLRKSWIASTAWCSMSQTIQANDFVAHGGFPLCAAINWSGSSQCTRSVLSTVSRWPCTSIWIHSPPMAWCFSFLVLPVFWRIFEFAL